MFNTQKLKVMQVLTKSMWVCLSHASRRLAGETKKVKGPPKKKSNSHAAFVTVVLVIRKEQPAQGLAQINKAGANVQTSIPRS